jgi:hypothetical protein
LCPDELSNETNDAPGLHAERVGGTTVALQSMHAARLVKLDKKEISVQSWHRRLVFCHHLITLSALASTVLPMASH